MEKTPEGTSVGVDDPYEHAGVCDHLTGDGTCRYAFEHPDQDPEFARRRRADGFQCPVGDPDGDWGWRDCPHFRSTANDRECARCGLEEKRLAHDDGRPLLEEHHLSYSGRDGRELTHEITVYLCRACHSKVHGSWARITDEAPPSVEMLAEYEERTSREREEAAFRTARERRDADGDGDDG